MEIAEKISELSQTLSIPVVFKASFDKANRTSGNSFRGHGLVEGLRILQEVRQRFHLPVLTDIHESGQCAPVAEVVDILQIPAFLCRQTDLLEAACRTGRLVNVKKGQFLSPSQVGPMLAKLKSFSSAGSWVTDRGVSFGYQRLVVDFAAFEEMERLGADLVLDITHSVQLPGAAGNASGGIRDAIPYLARAGAGAGVSGFFAEVHPRPSEALSDAANAWPLDRLEHLMRCTQAIAAVAHA